MRSTPATTATTLPVTNAQLKALIDQGVADALATRDANRSMNGDDSHNSGTGIRRNERVFRDISNCSVENQIKFTTCTILRSALTWWNSHVRTVGHDVAYAMTWADLEKKMTSKYCPRGEIKKLEVEFWNLKVKGTDVIRYNQRFQELALLCVRIFPEESDKIERYVSGLPDMIYESVVASKPKTMQEAIEMAIELMDKKIHTFANVRQRTKGSKMITTTKLSNNLPRSKCTVKCANCKKVGYLTRDCRSPAATNNQRNPTCYECGSQWHYKSDCPKLKNQNHRNQAGGTGARGMVHALGGGEINQDLNNMEGDIIA
ncbi:reverse transcriptase domain-containing protein [Tanacetum coccineum]